MGNGAPSWPTPQEWRDRLTWRHNVSKSDAELSIARAYVAAGLPEPKAIVWVSGPAQLQLLLARVGWRRVWPWALLAVALLAMVFAFAGPSLGLGTATAELPRGALVVLGFSFAALWAFALVLNTVFSRPRPDWRIGLVPLAFAGACIAIGVAQDSTVTVPPLAVLGALLALPASIALATSPSAPVLAQGTPTRFGRSVGGRMSTVFRGLLEKARTGVRPRPYGLELGEMLSAYVRLLATACPPTFDTPVAFYTLDRLVRISMDPESAGDAERRLAVFAELTWRVDGLWAFANVAVAMEPPVEVYLDERNRFHRMDGPAVRWRDGSALFAVEGRFATDPSILFAPDGITVAQLRQEPDPGVRRALLSQYGVERLMRHQGRCVARDTTGELWRIDDFDGEPLVMVRVLNSTPEPDGTRKVYWLRVPPRTPTPQAGVSWTFGLSSARYAPSVET